MLTLKDADYPPYRCRRGAVYLRPGLWRLVGSSTQQWRISSSCALGPALYCGDRARKLSHFGEPGSLIAYMRSTFETCWFSAGFTITHDTVRYGVLKGRNLWHTAHDWISMIVLSNAWSCPATSCTG